MRMPILTEIQDPFKLAIQLQHIELTAKGVALLLEGRVLEVVETIMVMVEVIIMMVD